MRRYIVGLAVVVLTCLLVVCGCGREAPASPAGSVPAAPSADRLTIPADKFPHLSGSTSAQPLGMWIACDLFGLQAVRVVRLGPSFYDNAGAYAVAPVAPPADQSPIPDAVRHAVIEPCYRFYGTHEAYRELVGRTLDLLLECRTPSSDELAATKNAHVEFEMKPIALDAFVFIVNEQNPVRSLTTAQIRDVYSGKVTNWKALGGADRPIKPLRRERNSGSEELMQTLVMGDRAMATTGMATALGMLGPYEILDRNPDGLAYTVYYYQQYMAGDANVEMCAVDGVQPTPETIHNKQYPYITRLYAVIRRDTPQDSWTRRLYDWLSTPAGQKVVAESGYVPVGDAGKP